MTPLNVLISLHRGYGLGDAVQMSAVLRHVVAARPEWVVDYQAEAGREVVGRGMVTSTFAYGQPYPREHYDAEVLICLYDTWANWGDRPNTRVASCLHEQFGLPWRAELGRYRVQVRSESAEAARTLLREGVGRHRNMGPSGAVRADRFVAVHYQGDSSQAKKNLSHSQADDVCQAVASLGGTPLVLDWRDRSPLPYRRLVTPAEWGCDAEMVCAVISQCAAFVGIDSGPSKVAGATDTPSLVVWTGHHPAPFYDPAPNVTHLVPEGYHGLYPVCNDSGVVAWFEANYNVRQYRGGDPLPQIRAWLEEILR